MYRGYLSAFSSSLPWYQMKDTNQGKLKDICTFNPDSQLPESACNNQGYESSAFTGIGHGETPYQSRPYFQE